MSKTPTFSNYWKRFLVRLWKDAAPWARDNIFWAGAMLVIPALLAALLHRGSAIDWQVIRLALYLYVAALAVYLIVYVIRIPWNLDQERQEEISGYQTTLDANQLRIKELSWPSDHPIIRFLAWSNNPKENPYNQRGFLLKNSGGVSLEVRIQDFKVGSATWIGKTVPGIEEGETQFALVWRQDGSQFEKFDLLSAMRDEAGSKGWLLGLDFGIPVRVVYRDAQNHWYAGRSNLTYIRTQHRLEFGPTIPEKLTTPPPEKPVFLSRTNIDS